MESVKLQVQVLRGQLDTLIKDVNSIKNTTIKVDASGLQAVKNLSAEITKATQVASQLSKATGGFNTLGTEDFTRAANDLAQTYGKLEKVVYSFTEGQKEASSAVATYTDGIGRAINVLLEFDKDQNAITNSVMKTSESLKEQEKAAEKAAKESAKRAEQEAKLRKQQEDAAWAAYEKEKEAEARKQAQIAEGVAKHQAELEKEQAAIEAAAKKEADAFYKAEEAAAQKAAEAHRKGVESVDSWVAEFNANAVRETEQAAQAAVSLDRQYANLSRSVKNLKNQYPAGTFDELEQEINQAHNALKNLDASSDTFASDVSELKGKLGELQSGLANTRNETSKLDRISESLWSNFQKFVRLYAIGNIVSNVSRAFREAVDTMKAVDDELVVVRKVTGATSEELERMEKQAYKTASAFGVSADAYLQSVAAFARAGYREQSEQLAELAIKTQLVGDVSQETANQFLLSVDKAYQLGGSISELTKVLDGANEIDNKYATSIENIAEGLGTVAPVAAQAHVGVNELTAAVGTITAVTQRSGSEAARALRALFLNIVGDTKTEIDEGVTWTTGEIKGLTDVIKQYAPEAYKAAQATGSVINPMEAIAGLAKSMKEGVLTEQQLMEMVSDIGGKLRTSQLLALIQNWDMYQSMLNDYGKAIGSADAEVSNALDSWSRKTEVLKNTWTEFISSFVDTDSIKGLLDGATWLVKILDTAPGKITLISAGAGAAALTIVGAIRSAQKAMEALNLTTLANPLFLAVAGGTAAIIGVAKIVDALVVTTREAEEAASEAADKYSAALTEYESLVSKGDELTGAEKERLGILEAQLEVLRQQRIEASKAAYDKKYSNGYIDESPYYSEWSELQYQLETAGLRGSKDIRTQMSGLESKAAEYGVFQRANSLIGRYNSNLQNGIDNGNTVLEITNMLQDLRDYRDVLGEEFPDAGLKAISVLRGFLDVINGNTGIPELTDETEDASESVGTLADKLKALSESADAMDTAISDVAEAMGDYGANSYKVYEAMLALEKAIPGSTAELYDFETGALKVDAALIADKASLLDLIETNRTVNLQNTISELERLRDAAMETMVATMAAIPSEMQGAAQELTNLTLTAYNTRIADARNALSGIQELFSTIGSRSSYTPKSSTSSSSSTKKETDEIKEGHENTLKLLKSELEIMEKQGASTEDRIAKMKAIQNALHEEAEYLRSIGADQVEINSLSSEWLDYQDKIKKITEETLKTQQELFDSLKTTVDDYYSKVVSDKEKELELEEKILAVQEAQEALAKAQSERNVRYFNAQTGQWEWAANAKNVKSAQDALDKAKQALNEYNTTQAQAEFKSAWDYVADQIKSGAMTFKEAYDYMYQAMLGIQDKYGVDLGLTLEDSIGGFKDLNFGIDGLTKEVADTLGASVGVLHEKMKIFNDAVGDFKTAWEEAAEKLKSGEFTFDDAFSYLRKKAQTIADKYGIDMTDALDEAIQGFDKTSGSIDDLWKQVVITLMRANSVNWWSADEAGKAYLHAQNEVLGKTIGATYDSKSGYWYDSNGYRLYDPNDGNPNGGASSGGGSTSGSGGGGTSRGSSSGGGSGGGSSAYNPQAIANANYTKTGETVEIGGHTYDTGMFSGNGFYWKNGQVISTKTDAPVSSAEVAEIIAIANRNGVDLSVAASMYSANKYQGAKYDQGGVLRGMGGIKATMRDEMILPPDVTSALLSPLSDSTIRGRIDLLRECLTDRPSATAISRTSIGTQNNGGIYNIGGISLSEAQARSTTVFELAQLAKNLGISNSKN